MCLQRSLTFLPTSFLFSQVPSPQLSLIPLCTLFPLNISRFHAYTRRHNRCVIVYPFAARDQGWDSSHSGALASSALGAVWEHSGKLDEKLEPKSHCLIWLTGPSAAYRACCLRVCQTAVDKHMYRLCKHCQEGWAWCWRLVHVCVRGPSELWWDV